jgi:membrane-bound ClpP family serine protease
LLLLLVAQLGSLVPDARAQEIDPSEGTGGGAAPIPFTAADLATAPGRLAALPIGARLRLWAVEQALAERRQQGASGIVVASIHDEIDLGLAYYVERAVEQAEESNAVLLVFDIETPGGRVDAAITMRDAILASQVPTIAFVNHRAWSAGALISYANDLIVVTEGASIGAATPIQMGAGGEAQPVEEKVVSALRSEFRSTAEATNRDPATAEAMVDADIAIPGIIEAGKLLTLTGREARDVGLVELAANLDVAGAFFAGGEPRDEVVETWAESFSGSSPTP